MNKFSIIFGGICFVFTIVMSLLVFANETLILESTDLKVPITDDKTILESKLKTLVENDCVTDTSKLSVASKELIKTNCKLNFVKDKTEEKQSKNHYVVTIKEDGSKTEQTIIFSKTRIK